LGTFILKTLAVKLQGAQKMKLWNWMCQKIRQFRSRRHSVTPYQAQPEDRPSYEQDLPPNYIPIETLIEGQEIPGTNRWVGEVAKVLQTLAGEQITIDRRKGVRLSCGHIAFAVQEKITENSIQRGIGGFCADCAAEGVELPAFCSRCGSHCDACGRRNLCSKHAQLFEDIDGQKRLLCPDCLSKAQHEKLFKKMVSIMLWPFVDRDRLSGPKNRDSDYEC
jgi:hypothetical protein